MDGKTLHTVASRVRKHYPGAQVLLFGSSAENKDSEYSDIDLCIVIEKPDERLRDISRKLRKELYPILHKPIDILVYDKQTFEDRASLPVTMEAEITEQGIKL